MRPFHLALIGSAALLAGAVLFARMNRAEEGCDAYVPADQTLIAHAGGGLPDEFYANSVEALDLAYGHGHRLFEIDFLVKDGRLSVGHDEDRPGDPLADVAAWFAAHPDAVLVTDLKDGNRRLPLVAEAFGTARVIPQIYDPSEYAAVRAMGFDRIIFTAYRMPSDDWRGAVNALDLWAVTIPKERAELAEGLRHPVFLHTVNEPMPGFGLYTDCLIPA